LVKRASRWQDSEGLPGQMIAKVGDKLTQEVFQKIISKLAEPINIQCQVDLRKQGIQLRSLNAITLISTSSAVPGPQTDTAPSAQSTAVPSTRRRRQLIKNGVDHLRIALDRLPEIMDMRDADGERCEVRRSTWR